MPGIVRFDDVLEALHSPDEGERERAARHLVNLGRIGLTPEQGVKAIKASALPYPDRRNSRADTSVDLIRAALAVPYPEYLPHLVQRYGLWNERTRQEVLRRLTRIQDPRAAESLKSILAQHAAEGRIKSLPLGMYATAPQFGEVLFPDLLQYLGSKRLRMSICQYALSFASSQLIDSEMLVPHTGTILAIYQRHRDWLVSRQRNEGVAWRWGQRYHRSRWPAGVLLDLMGYIQTPQIIEVLREALEEYTDPRLRMYAALALLRQDQEIDPTIISEVAECAESRKWLFDGLQKLERFQLYPAELRTQAALAESDLVDWLVHARELGRAPEEVELMKVVPFDAGQENGWLDYYLFRFRVAGRHWATRSGWLVGVAGPFLRKDAPTIQSLGDTHSSYRRWSEKRIEGHISDVRQLMKAWGERHLARDGE